MTQLSHSMPCPDCGKAMRETLSQMPMWLGAELKIIDNVPTHLCDSCQTQAFAPRVEHAIRMLTATGFPDRIADRQVIVPMFDLNTYLQPEKGVAAE